MIKLNLDFMAGAVLGFGAGLVSRELLPAAENGLRPIAKSAVKAGMVSMEKTLEGLARLKETLEDITAEAREEVKAPQTVAEEAAPVEPVREAV